MLDYSETFEVYNIKVSINNEYLKIHDCVPEVKVIF